MKETLRVSPANLRHVKHESLVYQSTSQPRKPLGSGMMMSATQEELGMLLLSVLRPQGGAFKGEL
jgi:hypothetical protein